MTKPVKVSVPRRGPARTLPAQVEPIGEVGFVGLAEKPAGDLAAGTVASGSAAEKAKRERPAGERLKREVLHYALGFPPSA